MLTMVFSPFYCLSLRGAQRRSNPSSWIATPSFLGLAMTNGRMLRSIRIVSRRDDFAAHDRSIFNRSLSSFFHPERTENDYERNLLLDRMDRTKEVTGFNSNECIAPVGLRQKPSCKSCSSCRLFVLVAAIVAVVNFRARSLESRNLTREVKV